MINVSQIRAARGLLGWSQTDLGNKANLSQRVITGIETEKTRLYPAIANILQDVFEQNGIEFVDDGLRKKKENLIIFKGHNFADKFLDYLYQFLKESNTREVLLNGINQELLVGDARQTVIDYNKKIKELGVIERLLVPENMPTEYMITDKCHYRGVPQKYFSDNSPTFIFGNYYAIMMFNIGEVLVIENKSYTDFQRKQYEWLWDQGKPFI